VVLLRHAETVRDDGMLYTDNLRSAKATDCYILKGQGTETYEPRFTYHGFRYVELTGYPGKPELSAIEGRVVHDDLENAGEFSCSNPLLNKLYQNIRWGVRGNYRSIPTDCPQRDEREGWMGDRSVEARSESYLFNTAPFYRKWLTDIADAQKPNGSVPDVCPAYWPIYNNDVTWPSTLIVLPGDLYEQYRDTEVLERSYPAMRKWMDFMGDSLVTGIITRDTYGDWCVPPEEPSLIHSKDPQRMTDKVLLATAFFYNDLCRMERYATLLNKPDEARNFKEQAAKVRTSFNQRFFDPATAKYANGSQTASVLALGLGLAPEDQRERVFNGLVEKITANGQSHVGTGVLGCKWLMRVLTDFGRLDLAYAIATQTNYPGWGYMVEHGATTIWELWNGDTADPAMNSGNHVMLIGDLLSWLYEDLAGIKPDPAQPGYKHILMHPQPAGDLKFAKASHLSPYGLIESDWQKDSEKFRWRVRVPVNTTATIWVPAGSPEAVSESRQPLANAKGVKFLRMENKYAVLQVGSGRYSFESP
jgi:alpha-L-rhamnosidase